MLRDEMGFEGLVFTDAMDMSAIARGRTAAEAAVRAIEAGADVILMPASVPSAIDGIVSAVESGRIAESRIDRSVRRILTMKTDVGLDTLRSVDITRLKHLVGIPEHTALAEHIAEQSITVLKNDREILPLRGTRSARVLSVTYRRASDLMAGRTFNGELRAVYPRLSTFELDRDAGSDRYEELWRQVSGNALVIVNTYVTAVSYQGSVAIPQELSDFIQRLGDAGVPHVVVSFGNPYLIRDFPEVQSYMLAWSGSQASQRAAARALFGAFEITGRVPTRIPPLFEMGAGITIPQRPRNASDG
jgi:beta-N-acetylhexosaminidase